MLCVADVDPLVFEAEPLDEVSCAEPAVSVNMLKGGCN